MTIRRFKPDLVWGLEWSHDCSKPRLNAFGGAMMVSADWLEFFNTSEWLALRGAEMTRERRISTIGLT